MNDIQLKALVRGLQIIMTPDLIDNPNLLSGYQNALGQYFGNEITVEQIQYGSNKMKIREMREVFEQTDEPNLSRIIDFYGSLRDVVRNPKGTLYIRELEVILRKESEGQSKYIDFMESRE